MGNQIMKENPSDYKYLAKNKNSREIWWYFPWPLHGKKNAAWTYEKHGDHNRVYGLTRVYLNVRLKLVVCHTWTQYISMWDSN